MRIRKIAIILLLVLLAYAAIRLGTLDYATTIIPGWHTTIYPIDNYLSWIDLIMAFLILVVIWIMRRRRLQSQKKTK